MKGASMPYRCCIYDIFLSHQHKKNVCRKKYFHFFKVQILTCCALMWRRFYIFFNICLHKTTILFLSCYKTEWHVFLRKGERQ